METPHQLQTVNVTALQAGCRTVEHCTWIAKAGSWGCVDDATVEARRAPVLIPAEAGRGQDAKPRNTLLRI